MTNDPRHWFENRYSEDQPRDDHGRFSSGSSGAGKDRAEEHWAASAKHTSQAAAAKAAGNEAEAEEQNKAATLHAKAAQAHEKARVVNALNSTKHGDFKKPSADEVTKVNEDAKEASAKADAASAKLKRA